MKSPKDLPGWITAVATVAAVAISILSLRIALDVQADQKASSVTFTSPTALAGADCPRVDIGGVDLAGKSEIAHDEGIWLLIQVPEKGVNYVVEKLAVGSDGTWASSTGQIGEAGDRRQTFDLLAVATDTDATNSLVRAQNSTGFVKTLPGDAYVAGQACVLRR